MSQRARRREKRAEKRRFLDGVLKTWLFVIRSPHLAAPCTSSMMTPSVRRLPIEHGRLCFRGSRRSIKKDALGRLFLCPADAGVVRRAFYHLLQRGISVLRRGRIFGDVTTFRALSEKGRRRGADGASGRSRPLCCFTVIGPFTSAPVISMRFSS